jgi:hypothetical protein
MKNSQKGFLIPLVLILIAVAIGGGIYLSQKNVVSKYNSGVVGLGGASLHSADANKIASDIANCFKKVDYPAGDYCIKYVAFEDQNPSICIKIKDGYVKDECYSGFAGLTKDISFCNKIVTPSMKTECSTAIGNVGKSGYRITDTGWANPQICDPDQIGKQSQNTKDICYKEFAREYKDVTLCSKIISPHEIESCYQQTSISASDFKICSMNNDPSVQRLCLDFYAQAKGDINACVSMKGSAYIEYPNWSKDQCYREVAGKKKDSSICSNIVTATLKSDCLKESQ